MHLHATDHEVQRHVGRKHVIHNVTTDWHNCSSDNSIKLYLTAQREISFQIRDGV